MSSMERKYIARSRGVSSLHGHLVITTKYRHNILTQPMLDRLTEIMKDLCEKWQCEFIEGNGEPNHYHLLFRYFPQMQLSKFIGNVKSISSRRIRSEFPDIVDSKYWKAVLWNEGYSIDAVGSVKLDVLKKYVQSQPTDLLGIVTKRYGKDF
jgi:putative transposase